MALNVGYLQAKTNKESDEVFTTEEAIFPLLPYIDKNWTIWCPFDMEWSNYVKLFRQNGNKVIATHIDTGQNFFEYEPEEHYDIIISNPPFSIKDLILKRLYELNKPYVMLLPVPVLQGQKRFDYMIGCQIMLFDKRLNYYKDAKMKEVQKGVSFGSLYLCKDFLPSDIIWHKIDKK